MVSGRQNRQTNRKVDRHTFLVSCTKVLFMFNASDSVVGASDAKNKVKNVAISCRFCICLFSGLQVWKFRVALQCRANSPLIDVTISLMERARTAVLEFLIYEATIFFLLKRQCHYSWTATGHYGGVGNRNKTRFECTVLCMLPGMECSVRLAWGLPQRQGARWHLSCRCHSETV